ncbi:type II toxin-antitoxin system HicB family antitoxin [Sphaerotilus mobilis]|uniref:HicB-like antitoxin of HicAB toxin-antitoxin system n=1 Tax=Sphaerotilus mobilis TaxID=47994 RepID=A0A4Q7LSZ5_9BURK|nr:type II toxin-antitoxin system HicB family antitoxin [Sphaerotilus mobilis]RZS57138.1 HicB-like antitoxin of HicAB toxin-antitoxin system [Sphaerotilus mobilis]
MHTGDDQHAHGVTFPDFPGCFAAADDWAGLPAAIQEVVQAHFHGEGAQAVPPPSALETLPTDAQYQGGAWLLADVDLGRIDTSPVRLNISLPANLVEQFDAYARAHGATRSGFLAQAARQAMGG